MIPRFPYVYRVGQKAPHPNTVYISLVFIVYLSKMTTILPEQYTIGPTFRSQITCSAKAKHICFPDKVNDIQSGDPSILEHGAYGQIIRECDAFEIKDNHIKYH